MNEDALRSVTYDFVERTATLVYEPDAEYDIEAITEYVDDASDGKAVRINIFEGDEQMNSLFYGADGLWSTIAPTERNRV